MHPVAPVEDINHRRGYIIGGRLSQINGEDKFPYAIDNRTNVWCPAFRLRESKSLAFRLDYAILDLLRLDIAGVKRVPECD